MVVHHQHRSFYSLSLSLSLWCACEQRRLCSFCDILIETNYSSSWLAHACSACSRDGSDSLASSVSLRARLRYMLESESLAASSASSLAPSSTCRDATWVASYASICASQRRSFSSWLSRKGTIAVSMPVLMLSTNSDSVHVTSKSGISSSSSVAAINFRVDGPVSSFAEGDDESCTTSDRLVGRGASI